ncbi:MAG TPA: pitrilysin family protein [Pyrinomonadaceae bacterium]|jgi:predicted Zn-dependent peptidase
MSNKFSRTVLVAAFVLAALAPAAFAQQPAPQKQTPPAGGKPLPFTLPRKETFTLPNGLQVTMVPYGSIPKVAVSAVVRVGNVNEAANQTWLADLTVDLMKEGTKTRSAEQIAEEAARMGGSLNAGVGVDLTTVSTDVLSEFGPEAVALIADVMQQPVLPEAELARLKKDYLRRIAVAHTQPGQLAFERFRQLLYPNHPYGRVFPSEELLNGYTIADVQKFYGENFGAARTHVYVAGQFNPAQMRKAVEQAFGGWARGSAPVENVPKPVTQRTIHLIDRPDAAQSTIYLGLPIINPSNPDYVALQVTDALLGGSFASRITANIREAKGYTYSPSSQVSTRFRDAYWVEIADVTTGVTGPSLKEIFYEIERLRAEPPTEAELQGIKNYLAGLFVIRNSSRQGIINQLSFLDLHKLPDTYLSNYVQNVFALTPQDVRRVAQTYLLPDKMTIVVVGDRQKIADQLTPFGQIADNK